MTFTKKDLRAVFDIIEKHPIRQEVFIMSDEDMDDLLPLLCEKCGGFRSRKRLHTQEECDLQSIWEIQET